jgi:hypothetical protein
VELSPREIESKDAERCECSRWHHFHWPLGTDHLAASEAIEESVQNGSKPFRSDHTRFSSLNHLREYVAGPLLKLAHPVMERFTAGKVSLITACSVGQG